MAHRSACMHMPAVGGDGPTHPTRYACTAAKDTNPDFSSAAAASSGVIGFVAISDRHQHVRDSDHISYSCKLQVTKRTGLTHGQRDQLAGPTRLMPRTRLSAGPSVGRLSATKLISAAVRRTVSKFRFIFSVLRLAVTPATTTAE